jgi:hypothetical protein
LIERFVIRITRYARFFWRNAIEEKFSRKYTAFGDSKQMLRANLYRSPALPPLLFEIEPY